LRSKKETRDWRTAFLRNHELPIQGSNQSFGLTHSRRPQEWPRLLGAAEAWAVARGCTEARAVVARDDAAKLRRFEDLGLARTGEVAEGAFELGAVVLGGVVLQKALMPRTASL
jgi:hypothetical protein